MKILTTTISNYINPPSWSTPKNMALMYTNFFRLFFCLGCKGTESR